MYLKMKFYFIGIKINRNVFKTIVNNQLRTSSDSFEFINKYYNNYI
jgi:hypothetical protein